MIDTKELRRLAQAATPGGWYAKRGNYIYGCKEVTDEEEKWRPVIACTDDDEVNVNFEANASFIAAANPAAVSELLDRLEAWENVFGHLGTPDEVGNEWHALNDRLEALRANVERMDEAMESLLLRCDDSDSAMYGTLSTSFVRDTVRIARGAKGEKK